MERNLMTDTPRGERLSLDLTTFHTAFELPSEINPTPTENAITEQTVAMAEDDTDNSSDSSYSGSTSDCSTMVQYKLRSGNCTFEEGTEYFQLPRPRTLYDASTDTDSSTGSSPDSDIEGSGCPNDDGDLMTADIVKNFIKSLNEIYPEEQPGTTFGARTSGAAKVIEMDDRKPVETLRRVVKGTQASDSRMKAVEITTNPIMARRTSFTSDVPHLRPICKRRYIIHPDVRDETLLKHARLNAEIDVDLVFTDYVNIDNEGRAPKRQRTINFKPEASGSSKETEDDVNVIHAD